MGSVTRRVVTFYSFKGGVGRTFALCDVAVYLARWGYRVLCVDLDLEAPGLARYFDHWLNDNDRPGMLEILDAWANDASDEAISAEVIQPVSLPGVNGRLALVKSGRGNDDYVRRLHAVDWQRLFDQQRAGRRLEALRERWLDQFDFVLIDSRTGWSDVGEICTIHLPDILVALFTPNEQSFRGALEVADASKRGVARLPLDRAPLRVVPVLTRVDKDEYDEQQRWTERLLSEASRFVGDWDPEEETPADVLTHLVVPYVPYWSYGERLAAMRNERVSSLSVGRAHETLAALLARGLSEATLLLRHRESYVSGSAIGESAPTVLAPEAKYDVYISYPRRRKSLAGDLAAALRERGVKVFFDEWALRPGDRWEPVLTEALRKSQTFAVLLDKELGRWEIAELDTMVTQAVKGNARLIPVMLSGPETVTPPSVRQFRAMVAPRLQPGSLESLNSAAMNLNNPGSSLDVDVAALAELLVPLALQR